eukprot:tig00021319_g20236.t1
MSAAFAVTALPVAAKAVAGASSTVCTASPKVSRSQLQAKQFVGLKATNGLFKSANPNATLFEAAAPANDTRMRMSASSTATGPIEKSLADKFNDLPQGGKIMAEYVWIDGTGENTRSKTRTLTSIPKSPADLPLWNFDGSSTGQAPGNDSEVILKPQAIYRDPFRRGDNIIVLCDCYKPNGEPIDNNTRFNAEKAMNAAKDLKPWFGIEQEYTLFSKSKWPLGWPEGGYPGPQGPYYCGAGYDKVFGREVADAHYKACLYAGVNISGVNAEVMPGQWEFQVGPCEGIAGGDQIWIARYLMERVCEEIGVIVSFDPKPMEGDWNGAGCHTNYSTEPMRNEGGWEIIKQALEKLEKKHMEHIAVYGRGNERRLTGKHETAPITQFSWGVANRGCSIRIPRSTEAEGKGYLEDRRPASNMDPYIVTAKLVETTCL